MNEPTPGDTARWASPHGAARTTWVARLCLTLFLSGCGDGATAPEEPTLSAAAIGLTRGGVTPGTEDESGVVLPQYLLRLKAVMQADAPAALAGRTVMARWQSSDTSVVRILAADSIAYLTFSAPGRAVVRAIYPVDGTEWSGAIAFRVVARAP